LLFGCWICSSGAAGFLVDLPSWQFISSCPVLLKNFLVFYLLPFALIFQIFNLTLDHAYSRVLSKKTKFKAPFVFWDMMFYGMDSEIIYQFFQVKKYW